MRAYYVQCTVLDKTEEGKLIWNWKGPCPQRAYSLAWEALQTYRIAAERYKAT